MEIINVEEYLILKQKNFTVYYTKEKYIKDTIIGMKKAIHKVSKFFNISEKQVEEMNIRIFLAPTRKEYEHLVLNLLKVNIKIPSSKARIAQPQKTDLVLLCPTSYVRDSIFEYNTGEYERLLIHEMTHMFHEYVTKDMEGVVRWFAEGLAVYLSEQYKYDYEFKDPVIEGISRYRIPSISSIEKDIKLSYEWGWTLVRYIHETYGNAMLFNIIRDCNSNNIMEFIKEDQFEDEWRYWVKCNCIMENVKQV